jgi:hypothetical protein
MMFDWVKSVWDFSSEVQSAKNQLPVGGQQSGFDEKSIRSVAVGEEGGFICHVSAVIH